jgi:hypothetical protein
MELSRTKLTFGLAARRFALAIRTGVLPRSTRGSHTLSKLAPLAKFPDLGNDRADVGDLSQMMGVPRAHGFCRL